MSSHEAREVGISLSQRGLSFLNVYTATFLDTLQNRITVSDLNTVL